MIIVLCP